MPYDGEQRNRNGHEGVRYCSVTKETIKPHERHQQEILLMSRNAALLLAFALICAPVLALADDKGAEEKVARPASAAGATAAAGASAKPNGEKAPPSVTGAAKSAPNGTHGREPYPSADPEAVVAVTEKVFP